MEFLKRIESLLGATPGIGVACSEIGGDVDCCGVVLTGIGHPKVAVEFSPERVSKRGSTGPVEPRQQAVDGLDRAGVRGGGDRIDQQGFAELLVEDVDRRGVVSVTAVMGVEQAARSVLDCRNVEARCWNSLPGECLFEVVTNDAASDQTEARRLCGGYWVFSVDPCVEKRNQRSI
jgi:hypothetical protein